MNKNSTSNNIGLTEKGYEEIAYSCTDLNLSEEISYSDSSINFFGVSSGIVYTNLDHTDLKNC